MDSLPDAVGITIQLDEAAIARGYVDHRSVCVEFKWPGMRAAPALIVSLAGLLPPLKEKVVSLELTDGTFELFPEWHLERYRTLRFGKSGKTLLEIVQRSPEGLRDPQLEKVSNYAITLIQHYNPDFDPRASEEAAAFLIRTIERLSKFTKDVDSFAQYLKYTGPRKRKAVAPRKNPERDVRAAILSDVHELSSPRIGEELGIPAGRNWEIKRENKNASNAAARGRRQLECYFGTEEWRTKAERMRAARSRAKQLRAGRLHKWESMGPKQQFYALLAEYRITSSEEEERAAIEDGFDKVLENWIEAHERGDNELKQIQLSDSRFNALSLL